MRSIWVKGQSRTLAWGRCRRRFVAVSGILAALATVGAASSADAAIIEHTFSGVLDNVDGPPPSPWQDAALKSSFALRYIFDTETPDLAPTDGDIGRYAVLGIWVSIDGIELQPENDTVIEVFDGVFNGLDELQIGFSGFPFFGSGVLRLQGISAITSDDLPLDINLDDWNFTANFEVAYLVGPDDGGQINGNIDQFSSRVVPTPPALSLLVGMSLLNPGRRRRAPMR